MTEKIKLKNIWTNEPYEVENGVHEYKDQNGGIWRAVTRPCKLEDAKSEGEQFEKMGIRVLYVPVKAYQTFYSEDDWKARVAKESQRKKSTRKR